MRRPFILFTSLFVSTICHAQQGACGLTAMTETATPIYPGIARAAHIDGPVIMLATFKTNGEVEKGEVVSGPKMLQAAAMDYVRSWRANPYTGPRTCPIVITFSKSRPATQNNPPPVVRIDPQHVTLNSTYITQPQSYAIEDKP